MAIVRNTVETTKLNPKAVLPYELRLQDFQMAMQDVYDFFHRESIPTMPSSRGKKAWRSRRPGKQGVRSIRTAPGNSGCAYSFM